MYKISIMWMIPGFTLFLLHIFMRFMTFIFHAQCIKLLKLLDWRSASCSSIRWISDGHLASYQKDRFAERFAKRSRGTVPCQGLSQWNFPPRRVYEVRRAKRAEKKGGKRWNKVIGCQKYEWFTSYSTILHLVWDVFFVSKNVLEAKSFLQFV